MRKNSYFVCIILAASTIGTLIFESASVFVQPFSTKCISCFILSPLCHMFVLHSATSACIESTFILSAAVSGIMSRAWPFPGTTKNTHLFLM